MKTPVGKCIILKLYGTYLTLKLEDVQSFKRELSRNSRKPNIINSLGRKKAGMTLAGNRMTCSLLKAHVSALFIIDNEK